MTVRVIRARRAPGTEGSTPSVPAGPSAPASAIPSPDAVRKIDAALSSARAEAERVLEQARAEARRIVEDARSRATELETEARRAGLQAGRAEVAATLLQLARAEQHHVERTFPVVLAAVRAVSERLVGERLEQSDAALLTWVRTAMDRLRAARRVRIFGAPSCAERLRHHVAGLGSSLGQVVEIRESAELDANTLRLESDLGEVTVEVAARVDLLVGTLEDLLRDEVRAATTGAEGAGTS